MAQVSTSALSWVTYPRAFGMVIAVLGLLGIYLAPDLANTLKWLIVFAVILDPSIRWLEEKQIKRGVSVALIALAAAMAVSVLLLITLPALSGAVYWAIEFHEKIAPQAHILKEEFDQLVARIREFSGNSVDMDATLSVVLPSFSRGAEGGSGVIRAFLSFVTMPIMVFVEFIFFLVILAAWDKFTHKTQNVLKKTIGNDSVFGELQNIYGFIQILGVQMYKGFAVVALLLIPFYLGALIVTEIIFHHLGYDVNFTFVQMGAMATFLAFISTIPVVGSVIAGVLVFGWCLYQLAGGVPFDGDIIAYGLAVFPAVLAAMIPLPFSAVFNLMESKLFTPRIVGEALGVDPIWMIIFVLVGVVIFGGVGGIFDALLLLIVLRAVWLSMTGMKADAFAAKLAADAQESRQRMVRWLNFRKVKHV